MSTYIPYYQQNQQNNLLSPYNTDIKYGLSGELISDDMTYGGIPYNKFLPKFEMTPNNIINTGIDTPTNLNDKTPYNDYIRSEIVNWGSDAPLFESDHTGRDPSQSRGKINLMYNGNRGNTADLPRHPEMFIGFTGNDPRGATNDPRLEQIRGFVTAHAANLQVSMGTNDANHIAERPWTNQAISYDKQYINKITKNNKKIFSTQKDGRLTGRNVVTDLPTWGTNQNKVRVSNMGVSGETINNAGYGEYIDIGGTVNQIQGHDLQKIINMNAESIVKKYNSDQDYDDQLSNTNTGAGVAKYKNNITLINTSPDHINIDSLKNNSSRNNTLSASMALAAKNAAMIKKSYNGKQHMVNSMADIEEQNSNIQQKIANSIQNIYKNTDMKGQDYKESNETANGKGFTQKKTTEIGKHVIHDTNTNISHNYTNTELTTIIAKGLKEGMDRAKLASQVVTHINPATISDENITSKSLIPSNNYIKKNVDLDDVRATIFKSKISDDTMIHKYPLIIKKEKKVHFGKNADTNNWSESNITQNGKTVIYHDDPNSTNKKINALSQTPWKNKFNDEMRNLKSKNPELHNRVQSDIKNSTMNWQESKNTIMGATPHQQITPGGAKIFGNTYNPEMWNQGYNSLAQKKALGLTGRKSALKDPTVLGTSKEELFKDNYISFTSSVSGGPKTLRADSNMYNDHLVNDFF
jgi:hypothetical protein